MSNLVPGLLSNADAETCMEMALRYHRFAEAAHCETVRQALEETARACVRAAAEARRNAYRPGGQLLPNAGSFAEPTSPTDDPRSMELF